MEADMLWIGENVGMQHNSAYVYWFITIFMGLKDWWYTGSVIGASSLKKESGIKWRSLGYLIRVELEF